MFHFGTDLSFHSLKNNFVCLYKLFMLYVQCVLYNLIWKLMRKDYPGCDSLGGKCSLVSNIMMQTDPFVSQGLNLSLLNYLMGESHVIVLFLLFCFLIILIFLFAIMSQKKVCTKQYSAHLKIQ